jgi:hypothetical protein
MVRDGEQPKLVWWQYWPVIMAVFVSQFGGLFLARWMPSYYAVAMAAFVGWAFAGVIWIRTFTPRFGVPRWAIPLVMGLSVGLVMGVLHYLFPLR